MHGRVFQKGVPCTCHLKKQTTNTAHFISVLHSNSWPASVLSFLCYILLPPCLHALGDIPPPSHTSTLSLRFCSCARVLPCCMLYVFMLYIFFLLCVLCFCSYCMLCFCCCFPFYAASGLLLASSTMPWVGFLPAYRFCMRVPTSGALSSHVVVTSLLSTTGNHNCNRKHSVQDEQKHNNQLSCRAIALLPFYTAIAHTLYHCLPVQLPKPRSAPTALGHSFS
jgi:hypothetical protein